jgi:hypothetical protein
MKIFQGTHPGNGALAQFPSPVTNIKMSFDKRLATPNDGTFYLIRL